MRAITVWLLCAAIFALLRYDVIGRLLNHGPNKPRYDLDDDQAWRDQAACLGLDHLFFTERGESRPAKAICALCPVIQDCLDYALSTGAHFGIWGGKTEQERVNYKRKRQKELRKGMG